MSEDDAELPSLKKTKARADPVKRGKGGPTM